MRMIFFVLSIIAIVVILALLVIQGVSSR